MKTVITVEIEIDDKYVNKRNNQYKQHYASFGYKSAEEALEQYPLKKGIADLIEDCLHHKQVGCRVINNKIKG